MVRREPVDSVWFPPENKEHCTICLALFAIWGCCCCPSRCSGAQRARSHVRPRWRKVLRDLVRSKSGTALVVLSLTVGVDTLSLFINAEGDAAYRL